MQEKGNCPTNIDLENAVARYQDAANEEILDEIVRLSDRLIRHFTLMYSHNAEYEDLYQAGCIGVLKAVERYDPSRGVLFSTYASHCILGEIRKEIRKEKSFYRPSWVTELQHKVLKATEDIIKETGNTPSLEDVAKRANVRKEGLGLIMQIGRISLEEVDRSQLKSQRYVSFQLPIEDKVTLYQAMRKLSKLQQRVLYLFYYQDLTQQQVADELGMSQRQVSRVIHKGLVALSNEM